MARATRLAGNIKKPRGNRYMIGGGGEREEETYSQLTWGGKGGDGQSCSCPVPLRVCEEHICREPCSTGDSSGTVQVFPSSACSLLEHPTPMFPVGWEQALE